MTRNSGWVKIQRSSQETSPRPLGAGGMGQGKETKPKLSDVLSLLPNPPHAWQLPVTQQLACPEAIILVLGLRLCSECV